nr:MAG TPA: hypothetical protein [Crassvirales sp.]
MTLEESYATLNTNTAFEKLCVTLSSERDSLHHHRCLIYWYFS